MTEVRPTMRGLGWALSLVIAVAANSSLLAAESIELPAGSRVLDPDILLEEAPVISPDGRWIAYFSKGWMCIASLAGGDVQRIIEVKETRSFALDRLRHARDVPSEELNRYAEVDKYATHDIFDLHWTNDSNAIVFGISSPDIANDTAVTDIWLARPDGSKERIVHIGDNQLVRRAWPPGMKLSQNKKFLVFTRHHPRPLIWNVAANRPQATPYLAMAPSSTSGRWLAVEKDTRQLVVVDEEFNVSKRVDEFVPRSPVSDRVVLHWSHDEQHVIWRIQIGFDHYSNWEGCRIDLHTKQRRILTGDYMDEEIHFTGRDGEFLRIGARGVQGRSSGLMPSGAYVHIVPPGAWYPNRLWDVHLVPGLDPERAMRLGSQAPLLKATTDFELFAIGLPRQEGPNGFVYHLLDRQRRRWRLSPDVNGEHVSPYSVIGFAENGKTLIGSDDARLFAIPVAAIQTPENDIRAAAEAARKAAERRKPLPRFATPDANP
jgi:hypothetical protein